MILNKSIYQLIRFIEWVTKYHEDLIYEFLSYDYEDCEKGREE